MWRGIVKISASLERQVGTVSQQAGEFVRTAYGVLRSVIRRFTEVRASEAAAGMAFYAIFALFPLLLFLVSVSSFVLETGQARQQVIDIVTRFFPTSQELVIQNLQQVLRLRGTVGAIATVSLLWSASGFFMILGRQVNRVWPQALPRTVMERRLLALAMVSGLAVLLILWLSLTAVIKFLQRLDMPLREVLLTCAPLVSTGISHLIPWVLPFLFFYILYRFIPKTSVKRIEALWGALAATLAWKAATAGFVWYLGSGLFKYHLVYGSLGSVIALLFWIYLSNLLILFGAHLCAAISQGSRPEEIIGQ